MIQSNKYSYLDFLVDAWSENSFFDPREIKGCEMEEIEQLKSLIAPYMKRMPRAIEEDLIFHGKYSFVNKGSYLLNQQEAIMEDQVDMVSELQSGFWVVSITQFGVLCDDHKLLRHLKKGQVYKVKDYDNPPCIWKTGDLEDDDLEIAISANQYTDILFPLATTYVERYFTFYKQKPALYQVKQDAVELFSEIETTIPLMNKTDQVKFNGIVHWMRHYLSSIVNTGMLPMNDLLYRFHDTRNFKKSASSTLQKLSIYSTKAESLYDNMIRDWQILERGLI